MSGAKTWPLVVFVAIAYAMVWLLLGVSQLFGIPFTPLLIIGSWSPNIAAIIVIGLVLREKGGIRALFAGWAMWRFPVVWYLAALSAPALAVLTLAALRLLGVLPGPHSPITLGTIVTIVVIEVVTGATGEELGWRGFLQLRLQRRLTPLLSALIVGVVWAFFHAPLWLAPGQAWASIPFWSFGLACVSSSVIFAWLVNGTGGSMAIASLYHFLMNAGMNTVLLFGMPASKFYAVFAVLFTLFAAVPALLMAARRGALTPAGRSQRPGPGPSNRRLPPRG